MAGEPFFRGENRADYLYSLLLQTACDWHAPQVIHQVARQWGTPVVKRYEDFTQARPPVTVIVTGPYVFVVSSSTQQPQQWVGNVLGAKANARPYISGTVHSYFAAVAEEQYDAYISYLRTVVSGRRVVFLGFSLGAAAVTLQKQMLLAQEGIASACIVFGSPRVGNPTFVAGYPADNFHRFQFHSDPVPGVPPDAWSFLGQHVGWTPFGQLTTYEHVQPGQTLYQPNEIRNGDQIPPLDDIILGFDGPLIRSFHSQQLYARIVRGGLPDMMQDGFQDFPLASQLDPLSSIVFWSSNTWTWNNKKTATKEPDAMIGFSIYFKYPESDMGFQEVGFISGTDPKAVYDSFLPGPSSPVLAKRAAFMSSACEIFAFRTWQVDLTKVSWLKKFTTPLKGTQSPVMAGTDDCLTHFAYSATRADGRQLHFRGLPKTWIDGASLTGVGRGNLPLVDAWLAQLKALGLVVGTAYGPVKTPVVGIVKAAITDRVTLTMSAPMTLAGNTIVTLTGFRSFPLLNGTWLTPGTGGVSSTSLVINATERLAPLPSTTGNVIVRDIAGSTGATVDHFEFNGVSEKKTGKISFQRRGRQSVRFRHR